MSNMIYCMFENTDYDWHEWILENWQEKLNEIGFTDAKIYFSGFYSQGSGACFDATIDHEKLLNSIILCNNKDIALKANKLFNFYDYGLVQYYIDNFGYYNHYYHSKTRNTFVDIIINNNLSYWDLIIEDIRQAIEELRLNLCNLIYNDLRQEYEFLSSEQVIIEILSQYEFLSDGEIFNEN